MVNQLATLEILLSLKKSTSHIKVTKTNQETSQRLLSQAYLTGPEAGLRLLQNDSMLWQVFHHDYSPALVHNGPSGMLL